MGDLLYEFAQWLRATPLAGISEGLADTGMSAWLVEHFWFIPLLQTMHIIALTMFFGSVLLMTLRLFGRTHTSLTIAEAAHRFVPWMKASLALLALSGVLLIIAEPERELLNPIFWIKVVLIVATILASISHHKSLFALAGNGPAGGKVQLRAVLLLLVWCVVILCGRWIAYSPV
jgi:uncharacterized membrane protein